LLAAPESLFLQDDAEIPTLLADIMQGRGA
jgi:hypothetical protein